MALISEFVIPHMDCVSDGSPILQMRKLRPRETKFVILQPGLPGSPPGRDVALPRSTGLQGMRSTLGPAGFCAS